MNTDAIQLDKNLNKAYWIDWALTCENADNLVDEALSKKGRNTNHTEEGDGTVTYSEDDT